MAKLTVIVGLPGSGKSTLLRTMKPSIAGLCIPDYQAGALHDSPAITASKYYATLVQTLRSDKDCLIADVAFTDTWKRLELEQVIGRDVPGVAFAYRWFENDLDQCLANIRGRNRPMVDREVALATELAERYFPPVGVELIPVWRPTGEVDLSWRPPQTSDLISPLLL